MNKPAFDRVAVLAYLLEQGPASSRTLHAATASALTISGFSNGMRRLRQDGFVRSATQARVALWVPMLDHVPAVWRQEDATTQAMALTPAAQAEPETEPMPEQHVYPRYCPAVPPPRQHDTRQCTGWRPPAMACTRPGATDFLSLPSRVGEQRKPHQPGYIAALASGHNPPADA